MEERLQKIISARMGISRRAAEALISQGRVTLNGDRASLGEKADPVTAEIEVDGISLVNKDERKIYIMLNKPIGYVTTMSDEQGRKTVRELVSDIPERVYPVGRLDLNSEGLLIMTNDGEFANMLMHPSFEKDKCYRVSVMGDVEAGIKALSEPMELDGTLLRKPDIQTVSLGKYSAVLDITIHEGKNRQVRRMCYNAGLKVKRLTRISEGGVSLGRLKKGQWRYLTKEELEILKRR